jgi:glycerophosphoryl diester phosphodiesterase
VVERAHEAGLQVVAWTVNEVDRALELAHFGVDVLITDQLSRLRRLFSGLSQT